MPIDPDFWDTLYNNNVISRIFYRCRRSIMCCLCSILPISSFSSGHFYIFSLSQFIHIFLTFWSLLFRLCLGCNQLSLGSNRCCGCAREYLLRRFEESVHSGELVDERYVLSEGEERWPGRLREIGAVERIGVV